MEDCHSLHGTMDVTMSGAVINSENQDAAMLESLPCREMVAYEEGLLAEEHNQQDVIDSVQQGMTTHEAIAFTKLKAFCSCIVKKLAPPY